MKTPVQSFNSELTSGCVSRKKDYDIDWILNNSFWTDFEDDGEDESDSGWQQELQRRYAQEANFMAELRARHPVSPPENIQSNAMNYTQNLAHNYNQPVQNFHIQGINYPQNHNVTSSSGYGGQQILSNYGAPSRNSGPFGNPVSGNSLYIHY